jgi:UDP-N-acetylmuramoylalanine-D-glutamate ligase
MTIQKTLKERQKTHGNFITHALIAQSLKDVMRDHGVNELAPDQVEALEMIAHKIARILNGNPNHHDHWHDIAGYATLVTERL